MLRQFCMNELTFYSNVIPKRFISLLTVKKTEESVKKERFRLLKETNKCETALNKMIEQVTMLDNVISIINQNKEIVRTQKKGEIGEI